MPPEVQAGAELRATTDLSEMAAPKTAITPELTAYVQSLIQKERGRIDEKIGVAAMDMISQAKSHAVKAAEARHGDTVRYVDQNLNELRARFDQALAEPRLQERMRNLLDEALVGSDNLSEAVAGLIQDQADIASAGGVTDERVREIVEHELDLFESDELPEAVAASINSGRLNRALADRIRTFLFDGDGGEPFCNIGPDLVHWFVDRLFESAAFKRKLASMVKSAGKKAE